MGFIAQDVIEIITEVVVVDDSDENNYLYMRYEKLTALLCEGIKEQQVLISSLTSTVVALEARVAALEAA